MKDNSLKPDYDVAIVGAGFAGMYLKGKRVAVIGTGSSGIQSITHIAAESDFVTVFQRTPNHSIPAHNQ